LPECCRHGFHRRRGFQDRRGLLFQCGRKLVGRHKDLFRGNLDSFAGFSDVDNHFLQALPHTIKGLA
jgi:hypothetical protein